MAALPAGLAGGCGSAPVRRSLTGPGGAGSPAPASAPAPTSVPAPTSAAALRTASPAPVPAGRSMPVPASPPTPTSAAASASAAGAAPSPSVPSPAAPVFAADVSPPLRAADLPYTWRPGCPVAPYELRRIRVGYWGFDGLAHTGAIVVNVSVVPSVVTVFRTLFAERFPLREVVPVDAYYGRDDSAAAADDTSGFNCRDAVTSGPPQWSAHAYGEAIDVNDVENPYMDGSTIIPAAGAAYADRSVVRPGMAVPAGRLVEAFASVGWQWGGRWAGSPDYQHFSLTGG